VTSMTSNLDLEGKRILVTGSSRGIGRTTALMLGSRGALVIVHARSASEHTTSLLDELGDRGRLALGDLSLPDGAGDVWTSAVAAFGGIDVVINNAGAWLPSAVDSDSDWKEGWAANLALNLTAPAELCQRAIKHFTTRKGDGIIINVTSRSAHRGDDAEHLAYGAAKGGLQALTKGIARGFGRDGILAYAVAPGWVATDLVGDAVTVDMLDLLPLGEVIPAREVAEMIAFLATGKARHTTGATIDITGADYVR